MSPSETEYLRHILDEIDYLTEHSNNLSFEKFVHDETLKRAFIRSLEIVGEAAKKPSENFEKITFVWLTHR